MGHYSLSGRILEFGGIVSGLEAGATTTRVIDRQRLLRLREEALRRRLTTVVAGAGFGKTTLVRAWSTPEDVVLQLRPSDSDLNTFARTIIRGLQERFPRFSTMPPVPITPGDDEGHAADAFAESVAESLHGSPDADLLMIIDDVHELQSGSAAARALETLVRNAPPFVHIVLSSRSRPPFSVERLRGQGEIVAIDASSLAFTSDEMEEVLSELSLEPEVLLPPILSLTGGWPALVMMCVDELIRTEPRQRGRVLASYTKASGSLFSYLLEEVMAGEDEDVRNFIRTSAVLEKVSPELSKTLGFDRGPEFISELVQRGILTESTGPDEWFTLHGLTRAFCHERAPLQEEERRRVLLETARWFESRNALPEAMSILQQFDSPDELTSFLERKGDDLLQMREASTVLKALDLIPTQQRTPQLQLLAARGLMDLGDDLKAASILESLIDGAETIPAELGSQLAMIYSKRDDGRGTHEILDKISLDHAGPDDLARIGYARGWALYLEGNLAEAENALLDASRAADEAGNDHLFIAAQGTFSELAAWRGDPAASKEAQQRSLERAESMGDNQYLQRMRVHIATDRIEKGRYAEALEHLEAAIIAADASGFGPRARARFLILVLSNRGNVFFLQGRLDEAVRDFRELETLALAHRPPMAGLALFLIGAVNRARGDVAMARICYDESAELLGSSRRHDYLHAQMGLAALSSTEDLEGSLARAREILHEVEGTYPEISLDAGWIELMAENRERALELSDSVADWARRVENPSFLASALELRALAEDPPNFALLTEAQEIFANLGEALSAERVAYISARLSPDPQVRANLASHARALEKMGVRTHLTGATGPWALLPSLTKAEVEVRTLGGFAVTVGGNTLASSEWPSKKSRDMLKILIARRGTPIHREAMMDMLWPDEGPEELANRFAVALSGLRSALDPHRQKPQDHFVRLEDQSLSLDMSQLVVDLELFLSQAEKALSSSVISPDEACSLLEDAEQIYGGDFLEADLYESWALTAREQARALFISVESALASCVAERGDHLGAVRHFLRILERDPYDENAHLGLVEASAAAGRAGEARRHYRNYVARMRELDVEPAPYPSSPKKRE